MNYEYVYIYISLFRLKKKKKVWCPHKALHIIEHATCICATVLTLCCEV